MSFLRVISDIIELRVHSLSFLEWCRARHLSVFRKPFLLQLASYKERGFHPLTFVGMNTLYELWKWGVQRIFPQIAAIHQYKRWSSHWRWRNYKYIVKADEMKQMASVKHRDSKKLWRTGSSLFHASSIQLRAYGGDQFGGLNTRVNQWHVFFMYWRKQLREGHRFHSIGIDAHHIMRR